MIRQLQIRRGAFARHLDAPLAELLWLDDADTPWRRSGGNGAELLLDAAQHIVCVDVTDDDDRRVVRHVIPPVVLVEIVARHRLQI